MTIIKAPGLGIAASCDVAMPRSLQLGPRLKAVASVTTSDGISFLCTSAPACFLAGDGGPSAVLGAAAADAGVFVTIRSVKYAGLPRKGDGVLRPSIAPRWGKGKLSSGETALIFHSMRELRKTHSASLPPGPPQLARSSSTTAPTSVILPRGPCLYLNPPMPRPRIQAARQSREASGWCLLTLGLGLQRRAGRAPPFA
jgi:hypothetical protein